MGRPVEKRGKLGVWVDERGWTRQRLADELGITLASAARLCSDARRPSLEMAVKIEDLTKGAVPVRYWVQIPAHVED
jgi:transcriptional regulator with XRE-family HTH domain